MVIVLVIILIDTYSPGLKVEQKSSSNQLESEYNYQEIQNYLEAKRNTKTERIVKQAILNKCGTALLLYLEDNYQFSDNFNDLLGGYLVEIPPEITKLNYITDDFNLLDVIKGFLAEGNLNKSITFKPYSLLVDSSAKMIYLMQGEEQVKAYPIGVGSAESPTPKGEFRIKNKLKLSGKDKEIYGDYWLGIDLWTKGGSYGIHGSTNQELPVSQQESKGCIRMRAEDLEQLYHLIPLRTKIVIK